VADIAGNLKQEHENLQNKRGNCNRENNNFFSLKNENWDEFIKDDDLLQKVQNITCTQFPDKNKPDRKKAKSKCC
jgi:hypothetical protein